MKAFREITYYGDPELPEKYPAMADAVRRRIDNWENADDIRVYMNPPDKQGFIEWGLDIRKNNQRVIFIGAIQRTLESPVEFHS